MVLEGKDKNGALAATHEDNDIELNDKKSEKARGDPIISILGRDLGPWQLIVCMWIFLSKPPTGWVQLSTIFLVAPIDFKCVDPPEASNCSAHCNQYEYDRSVFKETIITEWDLVCERSYLGSVQQSFVMVGIMLGNMLFGTLADKYGRRPLFVLACMIQLVSGCLVSAAPWFWLFCVLRFVDGFATGGTMCTGFVIIMEVVGKSKRELMSLLYQIPFNLGHATLPLFAYFLREWRWYHLSFSSFSILYIIFYWSVPESPRWLLTTGRTERAIAVLEAGAKRNKMPTSHIRADLESAQKLLTAGAPTKRGTMADLFRFPYLRRKTLAMAFNWLVCCLVYYGLSQYITNLSGNIFTNVAIGACLGVPGSILCVPMTIYLGRRWTLFLSQFISGVSLIILAFAPDLGQMMTVTMATLGLFGASLTFPNIYLYGGELFPTVVRNSGVGLCSFVGRLGSICAPFVSQMSTIGMWMPPAVFGSFALAAALVVFLLPETRGYPLPETIEDGENFGKKKPSAV